MIVSSLGKPNAPTDQMNLPPIEAPLHESSHDGFANLSRLPCRGDKIVMCPLAWYDMIWSAGCCGCGVFFWLAGSTCSSSVLGTHHVDSVSSERIMSASCAKTYGDSVVLRSDRCTLRAWPTAFHILARLDALEVNRCSLYSSNVAIFILLRLVGLAHFVRGLSAGACTVFNMYTQLRVPTVNTDELTWTYTAMP